MECKLGRYRDGHGFAHSEGRSKLPLRERFVGLHIEPLRPAHVRLSRRPQNSQSESCGAAIARLMYAAPAHTTNPASETVRTRLPLLIRSPASSLRMTEAWLTFALSRGALVH